MSYIKSYSFLKRTFVLLSPLFLVTLASKELAFYAPAATLSPILGDLGLSGAPNSLINLENEIKTELPEEVQSYGDLMIQKTSYSEVWIEQQNPLSSLKYGQDFKFEKLDETPNGKKVQISKQEENKYQIQKSSFEASEIKEKGGLNLLTVFDLQIPFSEAIQITHVASLQDLVSSREKYYSVVDVENKDLSKTEKHQLKLVKEDTHLDISIESQQPQVFPVSASIGHNLSSLVIKSFYILYNDSPALDPEKYFTSSSEDSQVVGGDSAYSRSTKVFLDKWKSNVGGQTTEPTYEFNTNNGFWTSTCSDPYKVGGFIDEELKGKPTATTVQSSKDEKTGNGNTKLKKQKSSYVEFRPEVKSKPQHNKQYYYKELTTPNQWVPSDDNTSNQPCEKLDETTKSKLQEYAPDKYKNLSLEKNKVIQKDLIPNPILDELTSPSPELKYPYNKIIQSSFRAWGNTYNTHSISGEQIKEHGIYSSTFERAVKTEHSFNIILKKEQWTQHLLKHKSLLQKRNDKEFNTNPDVSSLIEVHYPISYSIYDPISNYLRKYRLLLKTALDLRYLYLQSSFSREVFKVDLSHEHRKIGKDYQGFDPDYYLNKAKEFGISGTLSFIAGLELDKSKDLKVTLTVQTNGFVNTKNPSCDLRHRLYKISQSGYQTNGSNTLSEDWKCSKEKGWKYRDYIHIPSYLVISLTKEPEITSFYIDSNSGIDAQTLLEKDSEAINTLKKFEAGLDNKEIIKVIETTEENNGEIYFQDIAVYDDRTDREKGDFLQLQESGWFSNTNHQYIYYYRPKQQTNKLDNLDLDGISEIVLHINGSKNSYSSFFHSGHFNTLKTLCFTETHKTQTHNKECGDGEKYEQQHLDKSNSDLQSYANSQTLTIPYSEITGKNKDSPLKVVFRVVLNRPSPDKPENDKNKFESTKSQLEKLFKEENQEPKWNNIVAFSLLAVWYSVEIWNENKALHYVTKLRPISMVSEQISNSTAHKATAAAGSAGFEISKFEFKYSKSPSN